MNDHPAFPPHLTTPQPIEAILPGLGFSETALGFARRWSGLEFVACEDPFAWSLMREGRVTEREMWSPRHLRVSSPIKPIELLATLYKMWADTFETAAPPDEHLRLGKAWLDYQRELRNLIPKPPTLFAEREFFRKRAAKSSCRGPRSGDLAAGQLATAAGTQRCGSSSSMRLFGWVGSRASTSLR